MNRKLLTLSVTSLTIGVIGLAAVFAKPGTSKETPSAAADPNKVFQCHGKVLDPDGKPCPGAEITFANVRGNVMRKLKSEADGTFTIEFKPSEIEVPLGRDWGDAVILADNDEFAPAWIRAGTLRKSPDVTLQLKKDDVAIRGQIVDADGRPVANAVVRVNGIQQPKSGTLDDFLKMNRDEPLDHRIYSLMDYASASQLNLVVDEGEAVEFPDAEEYETKTGIRTDKEGRFVLRGLGKERKVMLQVEGPKIVSESFDIVMRPKLASKWKRTHLSRNTRMRVDSGMPLPTVYPCHFTHVASPSVPVKGRVISKDTGEPLADVRISAQMKGAPGGSRAKTNKEGRYEIQGLPTAGVVTLFAICPDGMPYLNAEKSRLEYSATSPLNDTAFELSKGVLIRGRLLDESGKPVVGRVEYTSLLANKFMKRLSDPHGPYGDHITKMDDGNYEVVGMPGIGLIVAKTYGDQYLPASAEGLDLPVDDPKRISTGNRGVIMPEHYDVAKKVEFESTDEEHKIDLVVRSGKAIAAKLVDTEGSPLHGTKVKGISANGYWEDLDSSELLINGLSPGETRPVFVRHVKRNLGAFVVASSDQKSVTITLRPCGTITGRVVDTKGRPMAGARYALFTSGAFEAISNRDRSKMDDVEEIKTGECDADGRFRITDAIVGIPCELLVVKKGRGEKPILAEQFLLRTGEKKDFRDITFSK